MDPTRPTSAEPRDGSTRPVSRPSAALSPIILATKAKDLLFAAPKIEARKGIGEKLKVNPATGTVGFAASTRSSHLRWRRGCGTHEPGWRVTFDLNTTMPAPPAAPRANPLPTMSFSVLAGKVRPFLLSPSPMSMRLP